MRDVRRLYSIGLPVLSLLICLAVAIVDPQVYRMRIRRHEVGLLEQGTVICLVPAVVMGVMVFRRRRELPAKWLGAWVMLITLGALYYAGEECSWGQNYFGWMTPDGWSQINDQQETNLHNTSGLFDNVPRGALSVAAAVCIAAPIVLVRRRETWEPRTAARAWFFPTAAVVPAAVMALGVSVPQQLYGKYDKTSEAVSWFAEMFLAGRHSELKEYFLAMFILMYVWSFATRLSTMSEVELPAVDSNSGTDPRVQAAGRQAAAA
jgi:hypothetical protein